MIKVALLHAPVVHIDLKVDLDQVSQLHRVEERYDFGGTIRVRTDAYLERRIDDATAGLTLPDKPSLEESCLRVLLEDLLGARENVLAFQHGAGAAEALALVAQHDADVVIGPHRAALLVMLFLLFRHEEGPSAVLLPTAGCRASPRMRHARLVEDGAGIRRYVQAARAPSVGRLAHFLNSAFW